MATKKTTTDSDAPEGAGQGAPVAPEANDKATAPQEQARPAAAPLEAPEVKVPRQAPLGSSTNPVAAAAAVQTMPGDRHDRLVTESSPGVFSPVDPDDLWYDRSPNFTFVEAKHRLHEEFFHVGAANPDRRLLYPQGAQVPRDQAAQMSEQARKQAQGNSAPPAGESEGQPNGVNVVSA